MRNLHNVDLTKIAGKPQFLQDGSIQDRAKECDMNQTELTQQSHDLLDRIRHRSKVLSLYDIPAVLTEAVDGQ
jgi:hypothetical protein